MNDNYEIYMQRCLDLARLGAGNTSPNPLVGSVIVHKGKIIGEGYHRKCGEAHAEINAINSVKDKSLLKEATLFVNLEPCSHYGKTPPCAVKIAELGIPEVVIGIKDLSAKVNGKGIAILKEAGIKVTTGVLEKESYEINRRFFTYHRKKRPYIILKWAKTKDGFIDIERNGDNSPEINWITNDISKSLVHKWRTEEDGILVGKETARKDNPQLTVREWTGKQPLRMVLDRNLSLPAGLHLFDRKFPTLVFNAKKQEKSENLEFVKIDYSFPILPQIMTVLYEKEILSLIVEGGRETLQSFIDAGLWDEARVFTGDKEFKKGVPVPDFPFVPVVTEKLQESEVAYYINHGREGF